MGVSICDWVVLVGLAECSSVIGLLLDDKGGVGPPMSPGFPMLCTLLDLAIFDWPAAQRGDVPLEGCSQIREEFSEILGLSWRLGTRLTVPLPPAGAPGAVPFPPTAAPGTAERGLVCLDPEPGPTVQRLMRAAEPAPVNRPPTREFLGEVSALEVTSDVREEIGGG